MDSPDRRLARRKPPSVASPSLPRSIAWLPWLGLGISSNLSARGRPHPYRLRERAPGSFDYLEYSAPLPIAEARRSASLFAEMWEQREQLPVLLHPVHLNLYGPELEDERALEALSEHAALVGAAWVSNDVAWWHSRGCFFPGYLYLPPPFTPEGLADCTAHVLHVQERLGVPLAIENPAVLARRGDAGHVLSFMAALSERTGAELLLDLGHLWSHQLAHGLPLDAGLDRFPLERVIELHIAGGICVELATRRLYVDDHARPVHEELFQLLEQLLPACPRLRAVTYEADGHDEAQTLADLRRLRPLVPRTGEPVPSRRRLAPSRGAPAPSADAEAGAGAAADADRSHAPRASLPWQVFRACYAQDGSGPGPADPDRPGDADGAKAERALRRLAVAERVDRAYPLTRRLLASDPEALAAFTASDEFRAGFEAPARDTTESFARYARRRVRERTDEALATVLAFETWALERLHERRATSRVPGAPERLPREVIARFPLDLSALLDVAAALRRSDGALRPAGAEADVASPSAADRLRHAVALATPRGLTVAIGHRDGAIAVRVWRDQPDEGEAGDSADASPGTSSIRPQAISSPDPPEGCDT